MKRLLIVSDAPVAPGYLPRLRFLCDYLVRKGYNVTVLTEEFQPLNFAHDYPIITIPMYSGGSCDWLIKTLWTLITDWHNRAFAHKFIHQSPFNIQHSTFNNPSFDLVLCTAFSDFPLGAAHRIAKYFQVPLLCDIRDLDEQVDHSTYQYRHQNRFLMAFRGLYRAIHICRRNKVLRAADTITTVSPWHADFIRRFNSKVRIIYNGFDGKQFFPKDTPTDVFKISYIGSLFDWQKPALNIVKQAIQETRLPVVLDIHTPQSNPIEHDRLGEAIRSSCIMLVLTSTQTHGMLTTKFYEALGCDKPILCVPSDNGALADLIRYTRSGIATNDKEQIKDFITGIYNEWKQNGFTRRHAVHREDFSREKQCEQIEALL